jgi:hypothetical protein
MAALRREHAWEEVKEVEKVVDLRQDNGGREERWSSKIGSMMRKIKEKK